MTSPFVSASLPSIFRSPYPRTLPSRSLPLPSCLSPYHSPTSPVSAMTLYTPPSSLSPQALPSCSEEATQQYLLSSLRQTRRSSHPSSLDVLPPNAKRSRRADPSSMAGCPSLPTYAEPKHDWLHRSSSSTVEPLSLESIVHPSAWCDAVVAPAAPNLEAHCPTPGLTPEDSSEEEEGEFVVESSAPLPPSPPASFRLGGAAAASSGFVKRDDLTARAVAKAAEMCGAAQTRMPPRQEVQQQQQQGEKDRFVNGLVGRLFTSLARSSSSSSTIVLTFPHLNSTQTLRYSPSTRSGVLLLPSAPLSTPPRPASFPSNTSSKRSFAALARPAPPSSSRCTTFTSHARRSGARSGRRRSARRRL